MSLLSLLSLCVLSLSSLSLFSLSSLTRAVQEKRSVFPRFYFIGDDDLLEILGQSTNPSVIQSHLKKLFAGIHTVQFSEEGREIVAMRSLEGELVPLKNPVPISADVEVGGQSSPL